MSEPAPEPQGGPGGSFMTKKFLGIPAIVWLVGAAILAYLYFKNKSGSSGSSGASSSSGSGTSTTGNIKFTPGTSTITVQGNPSSSSGEDEDEDNDNGTPNPQPKPKHKPPTKSHTKTMKTWTVQPGQTLDQIAKKYGISPDCLADANVYVKGEVPGDKKVGQTLGTGAGLKTGQVLNIPAPNECSKS